MTGDRNTNYTPVIHWITHEEVCVQQEVYAVRGRRPSHPDPTANEAIGRVVCEAKRGERKQQHNGKSFRRSRIGVWRWDDEQRKDDGREQDGCRKESGAEAKS